MVRWLKDKENCVSVCFTISEQLSFEVCFLYIAMEKEEMHFWGCFQMQGMAYLSKSGVYFHIARYPRGGIMPRLVNSVAQRHDCFALKFTIVPPYSHKMAAAAPDITSSHNYGQMLQYLFSFYQRQSTFFEFPSRLHLYLNDLKGINSYPYVIIGKD